MVAVPPCRINAEKVLYGNIVLDSDCADGKLYCRSSSTKKLHAPVNGAAIIEHVLETIRKRDPDQPEFHQAVREVLESLVPVLEGLLTCFTCLLYLLCLLVLLFTYWGFSRALNSMEQPILSSQTPHCSNA